MKLTKRLLLGGLLGLALLLASPVVLFRAWHLDRGETVLIDFGSEGNPPRTDIGLGLRMGSHSIQACCAHSTAVLELLDGARGAARKFEVRSADELVRGGYRSELRLRPNYLYEDFWYQARVFVPKDWVASSMPVIALQWHNTRDFFLGEVGTIPPLALDIRDNRWRVIKAWDRRWISPPTPPRVEGYRVVATAPMTPGKWIAWTFHVRWSPDDDGFLKVWMDGEPLVDIAGPVGHRDLIGPYMKAGVYVPGWKDIGLEQDVKARILYFDLIAASASRSKLPLPFKGG